GEPEAEHERGAPAARCRRRGGAAARRLLLLFLRARVVSLAVVRARAILDLGIPEPHFALVTVVVVVVVVVAVRVLGVLGVLRARVGRREGVGAGVTRRGHAGA